MNDVKNGLICSVIIPAYNDPKGLAKCLAAIEKQSFPLDEVEVLVVDNGSNPPLQSVVSGFPFATYVFEPRPGSYTARNAACCIAKGRLLAFTDADCIPHEDWLRNAIEYFKNSPGTPAIGGAIALTLSDYPSAAELHERVLAFRQEKCISENGFSFTANLVVRREAFREIGAFDDTVRSGGDRDWGHRLHLAGKRMAYAPDVLVAHPARASIGALVKKQRRVEAGRRAIPPLVKRCPQWRPTPYRKAPTGIRLGIALALKPRSIGLRQPQGWQVLFVAGILTIIGWLERIRLAMGGTPLR